MSGLIEIVNGTKIYTVGGHEVKVLQSINLSISSGEFISIRGKSGSGKSTLLQILGCMDQFTEGEYYFNNERLDLKKEKEITTFRGQYFGFVFQAYNLIKEFTVFQNIEAPMAYLGLPKKIRKDRAMELIERVGLHKKSNYYPMQLSGGQQQRVAIARALANQPRVIFADEPTGNLDQENGEKIIELLLQLHAQGTALILVTHDDQLGNLAKRSIYLQDGIIDV